MNTSYVCVEVEPSVDLGLDYDSVTYWKTRLHVRADVVVSETLSPHHSLVLGVCLENHAARGGKAVRVQLRHRGDVARISA
jgi:hypothetical protein